MLKQYKRISAEKAKSSNPEYWQVTRQIFEEQAARLLQRAWRKKKNLTFKGKYTETLKGPLSLRFLKEPIDVKAKEHAELIKQGKWTELDFNDDDFLRNIYKALRKNLISKHQLSTATSLYTVLEFFNVSKTQINQHVFFDETGPYDPASISYATKEKVTEFKRRLAILPENERCYFSLNFPPALEYFFLRKFIEPQFPMLLQGLTNYHEIIEKFLLKYDIEHNEISQVLHEFPMGNIRDKVLDFIADKVKNNEQWQISEADLININALFTAARVQEEFPFIAASRDYQPNDSKSPILSMIILPVATFDELHIAMHGEKNATKIYSTAGQFPTRMIRYLDEAPEKYAVDTQARPCEEPHPDLQPTPKVHNEALSFFPARIHDYHHIWRNGSNPLKPLIRYLRQLLTREKYYDMSSPIWQLTDMDFSTRDILICKEAERNNLIYKKMDSIFEIAIGTCLSSGRIEKSDELLMLIADMIIHHDQWLLLLGMRPKELLTKLQCLSATLESFECMQAVIEKYNSPRDRPLMLYVLAFHLKKYSNEFEICNSLEPHIEDILFWNRNNGLCIRKKYTHTEKTIHLNAVEKGCGEVHELFEDISEQISNQKKKLTSDDRHFHI